MKRNVGVALALAVGSFALAAPAFAQGTFGNPPYSLYLAKLVAAFRSGLEISVDDGATWMHGVPMAYTTNCPGSITSPCGPGAPDYLTYKIRIPTMSPAVDLSEVDALRGHPSTAMGMYYEIALIQSSSSAGTSGQPLCLTGWRTSGAGDAPVYVYLTRPFLHQPGPSGTGLMLACNWAVTIGIRGDIDHQLHVVTSDTVGVVVRWKHP